jgi:hypothetical protein
VGAAAAFASAAALVEDEAAEEFVAGLAMPAVDFVGDGSLGVEP